MTRGSLLGKYYGTAYQKVYQCLGCGYIEKWTFEEGVCPECGSTDGHEAVAKPTYKGFLDFFDKWIAR